jgi:hypothetical protein
VNAKPILLLAVVALAALPSTAAAQRTSSFTPMVTRVTLPPTTDGDRYVLYGDRLAPSFGVYDTVTKAARVLAKGPGCGWSELPRAAHYGRVVLTCGDRHLLMDLRTSATQELPPALGYAVGRRWLAGTDADSSFFLHPRSQELRWPSGLRDVDHPRLRRVCGRLRRAGGSLPDSDDLAYDRTRYLSIGARGLLLRPCNRRRRAVRLERGDFAGFELPDYATLSAGFVTWQSLAQPGVTRGYDTRGRRRWRWPTTAGSTPLHTRNALMVRRPTQILGECGSVGCAVGAWEAALAPIRRGVRRRIARAPARRPARRARRS